MHENEAPVIAKVKYIPEGLFDFFEKLLAVNNLKNKNVYNFNCYKTYLHFNKVIIII
jgi:hypothetical protein